MKLKRIISAFLTLVMLLGSMTFVVSADWADKVDENENPLIDYLNTMYASPDDKLNDMIMVIEQYGYQLWFEEYTGEVAVKDTTTGQVYFTNPYDIAWTDQSISKQTKQKLLSQLIITYLDNGQQKTMYSYVEAAQRGQIKLKNIKNGMRVEYTLGEENVMRLVPRMITVERFEEMILQNIDDDWDLDKLKSFYTKYDKDDPTQTARQIAEFQAKYPITLDMAVYVCTPEITNKELRTCEEIVKTYCPAYSYEELEKDHEITKYTGTDAAPPRFRMSLEYTLSEDGLEVRLPANGIEFDESTYQFQTVSILPYFGAGNNKYTGYSVIPDGSGSLIRFEDYVGQPVNVSGELYGSDYAYHEISGQHAEKMTMPIFGVVTNYGEIANPPEPGSDEEETFLYPQIDYSNGFLAIIKEGDSLASLMAECGGLLHPYNTVYATFTPRPSDEYNLGDSISVSGDAKWTVTSSRKYTNSYRIQYVFLRDKDLAEENGVADESYEPTWQGMATAYRDYLTDKGVLEKIDDAKTDIPLYIETFGATTTTERVLSFPVSVDKPLTTFDDIKVMHEELTEDGLTNVNFKLTGYANGGIRSTIPYNLKWVKAVGENSGFEDLVKYAEEKDFEIYPDFDFAYVRTMSDQIFDGFNMKRDAVRTIDNRYTVKRTYDPAFQGFLGTGKLAVSPSTYERIYDHFGPLYTAYNNKSISVASLGTDLNSDFDDDEPYHREDSKEFTVELLARLDEDYDNVMIDGGNSYAVQYADVILNASLTSSKYNKTSESIPFLGMVYHGSKILAGSATNMAGDINEAILNAIENGATMYYVLSYQNTNLLKDDFILSDYYSVKYDIWRDDVVEYYSKLNGATNDLQQSYITDHEFLEATRTPDEDEVAAEEKLQEDLWAKAQEQAETELVKERRSERLYARLDGEEYESISLEVSQDEIDERAEIILPTLTTEEEAAEKVQRYKTVSGTVVRVEYEGGVNFILNYNSYPITVEYDGTTYDIAALDFVRID